MKVVNNRKNGVCAFANVFNKYRCELDNVKCDSDELNTKIVLIPSKRKEIKNRTEFIGKKKTFSTLICMKRQSAHSMLDHTVTHFI